jgi:hypothetical protein
MRFPQSVELGHSNRVSGDDRSLTALGERDVTIAATEQRAGAALLGDDH